MNGTTGTWRAGSLASNTRLACLLLLPLVLSLAVPSPAAEPPRADYDVLVYAATPAGITAAVAAARENANVLLLEPSQHVGGMVTGGLSSTDVGKPEVIGGLALEVFERAARLYSDPARLKSTQKFYSEPHVAERALNDLLREARITLLLGERLDLNNGVTRHGARIVSIHTESGKTFAAKTFVDASYEGDLMAKAGVKYIVGRESSAQYGEPLAGFQPARPRPRTIADMSHDDPCILDPTRTRGLRGLHYVHGTPAKISALGTDGKPLPGINAGPWPGVGSADNRTQAYNFRVIVTRRPDNRVPFPKPARYDPARYELVRRVIEKFPGIRWSKLFHLGPIPNDKFDANAIGLVIGTDHPGANTDYPDGDYATRARIWQDHVNWVQGYFYFLANDPNLPEDLRKQAADWGLAKDEFADNAHWPYQLYVREARRMVGLHVMTQKDCTKEIRKPDSVGMGSFIMDSHCVQRLVDPDGNVIDEGNFDVPVRPYQIPYRCLTPLREQCTNLLVPVCLSASHVAYGSIRMEPQYMILGQASGVAAATAARQGAAVQDLDIKALQAKLTEQKAVLALGAAGPVSTDLPGIVVDDEAAKFTGDWVASSWGNPIDGSSRHDADADKGNKSARFDLPLPADGRYEIRLAYTPATNRSANTPVTVEHADGSTTVRIDQRKAPPIDGMFISLGTYRFTKARGAVVTIGTESTKGYVVVDAVQAIARN